MVAMVLVAVTLGFFIGGGPSLLGGGDTEVLSAVPADASTTTTTAVEADATTTSTSSTSTSTTVASRAPTEVSVRVANGSTTPGQAVKVGDRLKADGYKVLAPGPSTPDPLDATTVQHAEGYAAEAATLASLLALPPSAVIAATGNLGPANILLTVADDLVLPVA